MENLQMPDELSRLIHDFIRPNNRKTHEKKWQGVMEEYHKYAAGSFKLAEDLGIPFTKAMVIAIPLLPACQEIDDEGCFDEDWTPPEDWVDEDIE